MKRCTLRLNTAVLIGLLAAAPSARADDTPDWTLWGAIAEAERIVLAEVEGSTAPASATRSRRGNAEPVWHLRVLETWKGDHVRTLQVTQPPPRGCMGPPPEIPHGAVVVLVSREPDRDERSRVTGVRRLVRYFGAILSPSTDDVPAVRDRIEEALALQRAGRTGGADRRAWTVRLAADPATREHGVLDLLGVLAMATSPGQSADDAPLAALLTSEERDLLADGFVQHPRVDYTTAHLLRLLEGYESSTVDVTGLMVAETGLAEEAIPYWARALLLIVRARFESQMPDVDVPEDAESATAPVDELSNSYELSDNELRESWRDTRARLGLPDVSPLDTDRR